MENTEPRYLEDVVQPETGEKNGFDFSREFSGARLKAMVRDLRNLIEKQEEKQTVEDRASLRVLNGESFPLSEETARWLPSQPWLAAWQRILLGTLPEVSVEFLPDMFRDDVEAALLEKNYLKAAKYNAKYRVLMEGLLGTEYELRRMAEVLKGEVEDQLAKFWNAPAGHDAALYRILCAEKIEFTSGEGITVTDSSPKEFRQSRTSLPETRNF